MAGSNPTRKPAKSVCYRSRLIEPGSTPIDSPWLAPKLAPGVPVNQLKDTVENGGAIYTNPGGPILPDSRICAQYAPFSMREAARSSLNRAAASQGPGEITVGDRRSPDHVYRWLPGGHERRACRITPRFLVISAPVGVESMGRSLPRVDHSRPRLSCRANR